MGSMISSLFMMENRQFHSFIIVTMILIATHDSVTDLHGWRRYIQSALSERAAGVVRHANLAIHAVIWLPTFSQTGHARSRRTRLVSVVRSSFAGTLQSSHSRHAR